MMTAANNFLNSGQTRKVFVVVVVFYFYVAFLSALSVCGGCQCFTI